MPKPKDRVDLTFDECLDEIDTIVENKRKSWTFKASVMCDFDDIKNIILIHIWKKWYSYDQSQSLGGWIATIVKNQFQNVLRDAYTSTSSPCLQCPCNLGSDDQGNVSCSKFGSQSLECKLYEKWYKKKRHSHNLRLPVPLENHMNEYCEIPDLEMDLESGIVNLHERVKERMTKGEWQIYECLFVKNMTEEETSKKMGFISTEKGRLPGYGRMHQVKKLAAKLAKEALLEHGIETFKKIK